MTLIVRCVDRMVFEVDPKTLDPIGQSFYDAYCFNDPDKKVEYISHSEWSKKHIDLMIERMK